MKLYVVCIDPYYVRDAQLLKTDELTDDQLENESIFSNDLERYWVDIEPTPYVCTLEAGSSDEARKIASERYRYDIRCLFAQEIRIEARI